MVSFKKSSMANSFIFNFNCPPWIFETSNNSLISLSSLFTFSNAFADELLIRFFVLRQAQ
jgi:hypothetical protein